MASKNGSIIDLVEKVVPTPTLSEALPYGAFCVNDKVTIHVSATPANGADEQKLFADEVWAGAVSLSEYLRLNPRLCEGKYVLELGAGAALPSLVSLALGCRRCVITDYPCPSIIENIDKMVRENNVGTDRAYVRSHRWGDDTSDLVGLAHPDGRGFDVVLLAELLWAGTVDQHASLLASLSATLSKDGVCLLGFCHHSTPKHPPERDIQFLHMAEQAGFVITRLVTDESAWLVEAGGYETDKVHLFHLCWRAEDREEKKK